MGHAAASIRDLAAILLHGGSELLCCQHVRGPTSGSFMRAKVSRGPPRQAAQLGAAGVTQPASSKISAAVLPSQPGTGIVYTSAHTLGGRVRQGQGRRQHRWILIRCTERTTRQWKPCSIAMVFPCGRCLSSHATAAHGLPCIAHLLRGGHQVGGHLDLALGAVEQLGGGDEVLRLAACTSAATSSRRSRRCILFDCCHGLTFLATVTLRESSTQE